MSIEKICSILDQTEQMRAMLEERRVLARMPDVLAIVHSDGKQPVDVRLLKQLEQQNTFRGDDATNELRTVFAYRVANAQWMRTYCSAGSEPPPLP